VISGRRNRGKIAAIGSVLRPAAVVPPSAFGGGTGSNHAAPLFPENHPCHPRPPRSLVERGGGRRHSATESVAWRTKMNARRLTPAPETEETIGTEDRLFLCSNSNEKGLPSFCDGWYWQARGSAEANGPFDTREEALDSYREGSCE
jgi:hypothetical protein